MGWLDFLGGSQDPKKAAEKQRKRLTDPYRQTHERYEAMDELVKLGTPEALEALLERFTIRAPGPTVDEEEKTYCYQLVATWGDAATAPLESFVRRQTAVYWPLRALRETAGDERAVDVLLEAMADCNPGYHEGLDRLREIVTNLKDFRHDRVRDALIGLLVSRADEVRFHALHGLSGYPAEQVAEHFARRIMDPEETQRVRAIACELAVESEMRFQPWAADLALGLGEHYRLDERFAIVRRGQS